MINKLDKLLKNDELVKGSFILFIMLVIFNFFNYVFQISMAKMLGPADFSILAVLMSLIYILNIPGESIQTVISKYTSKFNFSDNKGKIKDLLYRSIKNGFYLSFISFFIFILISMFISAFLKIELWLLILTGTFIFYIFITPIARGILQGRKRFISLGASLVAESIIKVILAIILVSLSFKVYGAIGGVLLSGLSSFLILSFMLKEIFSSKRETADFPRAYIKSIPVLIGVTSIVLMYSLDTILARAFFSPEVAGQYAFVSLIGKVIIFVSFSIGKAMFPISSEEFEKGNSTFSLFKKSVFLVSVISIFILIFYFLFPSFIIKIISLGSEQYLPASNILFILGLSYTLLSLSYIVIIYKLSVDKLKGKSYFSLIFVALQILILSIFNSNLIEFALSFLFINIVMFLYSLFLIKK